MENGCFGELEIMSNLEKYIWGSVKNTSTILYAESNFLYLITFTEANVVSIYSSVECPLLAVS